MAVPGYARSAADYGPKVDPLVAAEAADALASDPSSGVRVLVFGRGMSGAASVTGLRETRALGNIDAKAGVVRAGDLAQLASDPRVAYIAPDLPVASTAAPSRAAGPAPVAFPSLATLYPKVDGAASAWSLGLTGAGVGVAVIDSGVTAAADFGARLVQVQLPAQVGSLDDTVGHGSFVAGVAGGQSADGRYVGLAPDATLYAVNVASPDGVYTSDVIAGLDWVLRHARGGNIRVVNLSLQETMPSSYLASALDAAVEQLWQAGIVVVAAAGNLGPDYVDYAPSNDPFVISVGAVDTNDTLSTADDSLTAWSSRGTTVDGFAKPEIVAPGRHIVSLLPAGTQLAAAAPAANIVAPGYASMSGTSFAAPQVAAAAAILLQQHPAWTPSQVKSVLAGTERGVAGSVAGALDLGAAVAFSGTPAAANGAVQPTGFDGPGASTADFAHTAGWARTAGWAHTAGWAKTAGWTRTAGWDVNPTAGWAHTAGWALTAAGTWTRTAGWAVSPTAGWARTAGWAALAPSVDLAVAPTAGWAGYFLP